MSEKQQDPSVIKDQVLWIYRKHAVCVIIAFENQPCFIVVRYFIKPYVRPWWKAYHKDVILKQKHEGNGYIKTAVYSQDD